VFNQLLKYLDGYLTLSEWALTPHNNSTLLIVAYTSYSAWEKRTKMCFF